MDYTKSNLLSIDLNEIYEAELHSLVRENEVFRVQNETLKLQLRVEEELNKMLQDELNQLKRSYEKGDASTALCSVTAVCRGLDLVKRKHIAEMEKLGTELFRAKQALKESTNKLQKERTLRIQAEAQKLEVIEIAEELIKATEQLQKATEAHSAHSFTLNGQALKLAPPVSKDISERQKTLKKEQLLEGLCEEVEELQDALETIQQNFSTKASRTEGGLHDQIMELQQLQREKELKTGCSHRGCTSPKSGKDTDIEETSLSSSLQLRNWISVYVTVL